MYPVENGSIVGISNNQTIQETHQGAFNIPGFTMEAKTCNIFPQIKNKFFLSIIQFYDIGHDATFKNNKITTQKDGVVYIMGKRVI